MTPKLEIPDLISTSSLSNRSAFQVLSTMDSFIVNLHGLPQELFDCIYDEVFRAPVHRINIDHSYKLPHLLTINSDTRKQFAKSYYANTTFVFDNDVILHQWLRGVASAGFLDLVRDARFINRSLLDPCVWRFQVRFIGPQLNLKSAVKRATFNELGRLWRNLKADGIELDHGVLKVERYFRSGSGEEDCVVCE